MRTLLVLMALVLSGCGDDEYRPPNVCSDWEKMPCKCPPDWYYAVADCLPDGSGWDRCRCGVWNEDTVDDLSDADDAGMIDP